MWGGSLVSNVSYAPQQLENFYKFDKSIGYDEFASLVQSHTYNSKYMGGLTVVSTLVEYTKPEPNPPVFQPFTAIPALRNTTRISELNDFTAEMGQANPNGLRYAFRRAKLYCSRIVRQQRKAR